MASVIGKSEKATTNSTLRVGRPRVHADEHILETALNYSRGWAYQARHRASPRRAAYRNRRSTDGGRTRRS